MSSVVTDLSALFAWVLQKLHVPMALRSTVLHCFLVFISAFGAVFTTASLANLSWSYLWGLVIAGAAAGVSAVLHYLVGMLPGTEVPANKE